MCAHGTNVVPPGGIVLNSKARPAKDANVPAEALVGKSRPLPFHFRHFFSSTTNATNTFDRVTHEYHKYCVHYMSGSIYSEDK